MNSGIARTNLSKLPVSIASPKHRSVPSSFILPAASCLCVHLSCGSALCPCPLMPPVLVPALAIASPRALKAGSRLARLKAPTGCGTMPGAQHL